MMDAAAKFSETSVRFYQTARFHIPGEDNLHTVYIASVQVSMCNVFPTIQGIHGCNYVYLRFSLVDSAETSTCLLFLA
jgi:hypothetical protein